MSALYLEAGGVNWLDGKDFVPKPPFGVADVRAAISEIICSEGDSEKAHSLRDKLWSAVLSEIAEGHPDSIQMARLALLVTQMGFDRWCA